MVAGATTWSLVLIGVLPGLHHHVSLTVFSSPDLITSWRREGHPMAVFLPYTATWFGICLVI